MPNNPWAILGLGTVGAGMLLLWLYLAARLISYGATKSYFQARKEENHGN